MIENSDTHPPSKCAVCDTYNLKGIWKCQCDAMNISRNERCWKCGEPKVGAAEGV